MEQPTVFHRRPSPTTRRRTLSSWRARAFHPRLSGNQPDNRERAARWPVLRASRDAGKEPPNRRSDGRIGLLIATAGPDVPSHQPRSRRPWFGLASALLHATSGRDTARTGHRGRTATGTAAARGPATATGTRCPHRHAAGATATTAPTPKACSCRASGRSTPDRGAHPGNASALAARARTASPGRGTGRRSILAIGGRELARRTQNLPRRIPPPRRRRPRCDPLHRRPLRPRIGRDRHHQFRHRSAGRGHARADAGRIATAISRLHDTGPHHHHDIGALYVTVAAYPAGGFRSA